MDVSAGGRGAPMTGAGQPPGEEAATMSEANAPGEEGLSRWVRRLRHPDEARRVHAAMRLTAPGVDASALTPALRELLADPDPHVRRLADWVLRRGAEAA